MKPHGLGAWREGEEGDMGGGCVCGLPYICIATGTFLAPFLWLISTGIPAAKVLQKRISLYFSNINAVKRGRKGWF